LGTDPTKHKFRSQTDGGVEREADSEGKVEGETGGLSFLFLGHLTPGSQPRLLSSFRFSHFL